MQQEPRKSAAVSKVINDLEQYGEPVAEPQAAPQQPPVVQADAIELDDVELEDPYKQTDGNNNK